MGFSSYSGSVMAQTLLEFTSVAKDREARASRRRGRRCTSTLDGVQDEEAKCAIEDVEVEHEPSHGRT
jgi:hypothetical protein